MFRIPRSALRIRQCPTVKIADGKCKPNRKNSLQFLSHTCGTVFFARSRDKRGKPLENKGLRDGTEVGTAAGQHGTNRVQQTSVCWLSTLYICKLKFAGLYGCVISSGFTHSSNCSPVSSPNSIADSFSEVPFLWAFFAILAALS